MHILNFFVVDDIAYYRLWASFSLVVSSVLCSLARDSLRIEECHEYLLLLGKQCMSVIYYRSWLCVYLISMRCITYDKLYCFGG